MFIGNVLISIQSVGIGQLMTKLFDYSDYVIADIDLHTPNRCGYVVSLDEPVNYRSIKELRNAAMTLMLSGLEGRAMRADDPVVSMYLTYEAT